MPNAIERDVYVLRNTLKNPIAYVRGTDLLPIVFHFRDFTMPSGATATAFTAKPDGNAVYGSATISGNDVTVDVQQQMFIVLGLSMLQVEIKSGEETLATFVQPVMVEPNLKAGDFPPSTTDINFLDEVIEQSQEAVNNANQAIASANTAIEGANTAASSANQAAQNANQAAEDLQDKVDAGDFTASVQVGTTTTLEPNQDATVSNGGTSKDAVFNFGIPKGDPGTAATIQVGTTQTVQPEASAEVTNTGTTTAAVLNFKIPRGEDGMTDLTAEYKDASEYTCQPTVNAPVVVKQVDGKTEQVVTTGKNLFNIDGNVNIRADDYTQVSANVVSGDTLTCNVNGQTTHAVGQTISGLNSKTVTFSAKVISFGSGIGASIFVYENGGYNNNRAYTEEVNSVIKVTCAISTDNPVFAFTTGNGTGAQFTDIQVEIGETNTDWEPYTGGQPSPSPEYPQDINGVGGKAGGSDFSTAVETQGRNLAEVTRTNKNQISNGVTFKLNDDGSYTLNGTCTGNTVFLLNQPNESDIPNYPVIFKFKEGTKYRIVGSQVLIRNSTYPNGNTGKTNAMNNDVFYTPTEDTDVIGIRALITQGTTYSSSKTYYPGIWEDPDETRTEWVPFKRTSITIPLTAPLYSGDKICYVKPGESYVNSDGETVVADGALYGCYRENVVATLDGSSDESLGKNAGGENIFSCTITNKVGLSNGGEQYLKCNKLTTVITNSSVSDMPDNSIKESGIMGSNVVFFNISEAGTTVETLRTWLSTNPLTVVYRLAQPYFEPFTDQSIFYDLRTDDTLTYIYSNDPINPNITVDVAKNDTGGILLESYATAQKNALSEADNASRLASVEQQLLTLNTTVSTMGGGSE